MWLILLELSFIMDKRKCGIALFITLMVIASIMSIIAVSFSYLEKVQKSAGSTSALIQGDLLYKNTIEILKRFFPDGSHNGDKLELLYMTPLPLNDEKSGFSLTMSCQPLMIGVPIAWLDENNNKKLPEKTRLSKQVLQDVIEFYEIDNPNKLEKLIIQSVTNEPLKDENFIPRIEPSKGIYSKKQFDKIITDYFFMTDDAQVLTVPWEKYFTFIEVDEKTQIDGVYLSAEFISIAFDIPLEVVQDSWDPQEMSLVEFLGDNGVSDPLNKKIYSKEALNAMHCETTYIYKTRQYRFNFNYIEGRSSNFEFNGQE